MTTWATVGDARTASERVIPDSDVDRVSRWLESASRELGRRVPDVEGRVASGEVAVEDLRDVVVDAVLRRWRSPEGFVSETAGDYSYRLGAAARATPGRWFADGELAHLLPRSSRGPRTVGVAPSWVPS